MAVYVKTATYKGEPFFFVRMQFGKGSERKELCGPRHVTEEAAKRDKESLDGKPIDEQRAIIQRLKSGEDATPRKRHAKEEPLCTRDKGTSPPRAGIHSCGGEAWQNGEAEAFFLRPLAINKGWTGIVRAETGHRGSGET